jgi:TRAP-type C4-dicarboxylate transport system substrate-binding protein
MGRKVAIFILVVLGLAVFTDSFSRACFAAEPFKTKTLKFASGGASESSFFGQHYKWWAEELEKRTGGRVKVQVFWLESLVKQKDMLPALQAGYTDVGQFVALLFASNFPLYPLLDYSGNYNKDYSAAMLAVTETTEKEPNLRAELEKQKVILAAPYTSGQMMTGTKKCLSSITDLKGKVVRVAGGLPAQTFKNIGANPVTISISEAYEALDRGTVSGITGMNISNISTFKFYEVAKCWYVDLPFIPLVVGVFMNLDVFRGLPKDIQDIILKLRTDYTVRFGKALTNFEKEFKQELETKHGIRFVYPSQEDRKILIEATKKGEEEMIRKLESEGHTGARKVIDYHQNALQKYEKELAKRE